MARAGCRAIGILICDRDTKFTERFTRILSEAGVDVVRTPKQAPNCNAYAKRFVLSIKSECLDRMVFFGTELLRRAVLELPPRGAITAEVCPRPMALRTLSLLHRAVWCHSSGYQVQP